MVTYDEEPRRPMPKPRFIPPAERRRLEAERLQKEADEKSRKAEEQRLRNELWLQGKLPSKKSSQEANGSLSAAERERRERYMGPEVNKTSKFSAARKRDREGRPKFRFDWDASEDTSRIDDVDDIAARERGKELRARKMTELYGDQAEQAVNRTGADTYDHKQPRDEFAHYLHWSEKDVNKMTERDWRIFKDEFGISTKGGNLPRPMRNWQESHLPSTLLNIVDEQGYKDPTPIQRASIPIALQARDLMGVAATGSGKTAAFVLPLLAHLMDLPPITEANKDNGPYALILAPTRELAQQIEKEAKKFAMPIGFSCVCIVGGHSLEEQAFGLRDGTEIIVATPGRLVDCLERRLIVLQQCSYIILDEADRMIDMGFSEPLNRILDALPAANEKPDSNEAQDERVMKQVLHGKARYRQTMMFSATMPKSVENLAQKYLRRPAIITIGVSGEAVDTVEQRVEFVSGEDKRKKRLADIFRSGEFDGPIIVFVNTKRNCETLVKDIKGMGMRAVSLHGSKTQPQREEALDSLKRGQVTVLVATDLAGRGIDVPDVALVVNFNMATTIEAYTHRIGRTGRAGKSGVAITFLGSEDNDVMYDLKQILSKSPVSRVPEELRKHPAAQQKPIRSRQG
jgi:ATP-dependent RNA helicase DDX23/PRP28